jgi:hypothetical protein
MASCQQNQLINKIAANRALIEAVKEFKTYQAGD